MRSGNRLPKMKREILAALAQASVVRVTCERPKKLAEVLRKELAMCRRQGRERDARRQDKPHPDPRRARDHVEGRHVSADLRGLPRQIWLVIRPTGERHFIDKLDDIQAWAKGLDVTIAEYRLAGIVHTPSPKPKNPVVRAEK